jgi:hypothetical protein
MARYLCPMEDAGALERAQQPDSYSWPLLWYAFHARTIHVVPDVLYHTWLGAAAHIEQWALSRETVDRVHVSELTVDQFRERYEFARRPVVRSYHSCALTYAGYRWWREGGLDGGTGVMDA